MEARCARRRAGPARRRRRTPSSTAREEPVGDLALHHHAPELELREAVEALDDSGVATLYGRFATSFVAPGASAARSSCERVAEVRARRSAARRAARPARGSSERSSSTAWTRATRSARYVVRTPRPGPISSTTSSALELGEPADDAEDVLVDEEVLPERLLRRRRSRQAEGARRVRVDLRRRARPASSPRASRATATVCDDVAPARSACPRTGCGARYGESVSARIRSAGTCAPRRGGRPRSGTSRCRRTRRSSRARAPRRAAAATRSSAGRRCRRTTASGPRSVSSSAAREWITTGSPTLRGELELRVEERGAALRAARSRGKKSSPISPTATDASDVRRARSSSSSRARRRRPGADGCPSDRVDAVLAPGDRERARARVEARADREDPRRRRRLARARRRPRGSSSASRCAWVSITRASSRSSSSTTSSGSSLRKSGLGSRSCWPAGARSAPSVPTHARVVAGQDRVRSPSSSRHLAELERAGELALVAEQLVQRLARERQERREEHLEAVDAAQRDVEDRRRPARGRSLIARPRRLVGRRTGSRASTRRIASAIAAWKRDCSISAADRRRTRPRRRRAAARSASVSARPARAPRRSCGRRSSASG